jgi:hypothetical protein
LGLIMAPTSALCSIVLQIQVQAALSGDSLSVRITTTNKGNEAAHRLQYHFFLGDKKYQIHGKNILSAESSAQQDLTLPFTAPLPGGYGLAVRLHYEDPNGYPLSAVSWGLFANKRLAIDPLLLRSRSGNSWPGEPPAFLLHNSLDRAVQVKLKVLNPSEFLPNHLERNLNLAPRQKISIPLELSNRAALSGSTYPLIGLASYVHQGVHHIAAAQALLRVNLVGDPLYTWRHWLWGLAVLILGLILGLAWRARQGDKRR